MALHDVKTTVLHLYRDLLRAATYLPDKPARSYAHAQIIRRFRNASKITPERLYAGRKALSILERASNGEMGPLETVLRETYGRIGRRRRVLVARVQRPQQDPSVVSDAETLQLLDKSSASGAYFKPYRPAFDALMLSQMRNRPPEWGRYAYRTLEPKIPEQNSWGRPVPMKARPAIRRKFWKKALDALLPPLPAHEWDRLRDLATGVIQTEAPPQRRPGRVFDTNNTMLTAENLKVPISHALSKVTRDIVSTRKRHKFTPRFLRRMYASVWALCPKLELLDDDKWKVTWGGSRLPASRGAVQLPRPVDMELFEGVDSLPRVGKFKQK